MSKEKVTLRLPENLRQKIATIKQREGFDHESEATREVLRRGIKFSREEGDETDDSAGEQLTQIMTGVAAVGAVVASLAVATGQAWSAPLVIPFWGATFVFAMIWASIRTLEGGDLW